MKNYNNILANSYQNLNQLRHTKNTKWKYQCYLADSHFNGAVYIVCSEKIQAFVRGWLLRKQMKKNNFGCIEVRSVIKIQKMIRNYLNIIKYNKIKKKELNASHWRQRLIGNRKNISKEEEIWIQNIIDIFNWTSKPLI